jgi:hypothetical protein
MLSWPQVWIAGQMYLGITFAVANVNPPGLSWTFMLVRSLAMGALDARALALGGFFDEMGWPQFTYLSLAAAGLGMRIDPHHRPSPTAHPLGTAMFGYAVIYMVLRAGSFF